MTDRGAPGLGPGDRLRNRCSGRFFPIAVAGWVGSVVAADFGRFGGRFGGRLPGWLVRAGRGFYGLFCVGLERFFFAIMGLI